QHGYIAWLGEDRVGLATYDVANDEWELTSLNSFAPGKGVGSALLQTVEEAAVSSGARRFWLITTNDNLHALGFYQRRGYRLAALYAGAVDEARMLKPSISEIG